MGEKRARVERIATIAPEVRVVTARPSEPATLSWRPGQFISVQVGLGPASDQRRSYTLLGQVDGAFELLVKDVVGGAGTAYFAGLSVGDALRFTGPMGFFVAEPSHPGSVVLVATGAGLAAALPIAAEVAARSSESGPVHLIWGLCDGHAPYLTDRLDALAQAQPRFSWVLCRGADWPGVHAALEADVLGSLPRLQAPVFYLVGNGDMCRRVRDALVAAGLDRRKQIRNEIFYPVAE
jgi:NAD(P)H-flavin reductase